MNRVFRKNGTRSGQPSFTLVEMLVVISIVGMLAGLMSVGIPKAREAGQKAKAKGELMAVIAALKAYRQEYGQWPTASGDRRADEWFGPGNYGNVENGKTLMKILSGSNIIVSGVGQNPKSVTFFEGAKVSSGRRDTSGGELLDPWGTQYGFKVDTDESGSVEYCNPQGPDKPNIQMTVIGVSFGKNKSQEEIEMRDKTWDDIFSWR
jgi:prepilin-type N-terminal cleavage/methylation domain-containing protein